MSEDRDHRSSSHPDRSSERRSASRRDDERHDDRDDRRSSRSRRDDYDPSSRSHRDDDRRRDDYRRRDDDRYSRDERTSRRDDDRRDRYREEPSNRSHGSYERGGGGYRSGGRSDGRDDFPMGGGSERRSPTPEGAVPLSKRVRKATGWDVHAPGYEQMSGMQAKATGMFQLVGGNRSGPMGQAGTPGGGMPGLISRPGFPAGGGFGATPMGGAPVNVARQRRRLYIGNVSHECTEQNMAQLFNDKMREIGYANNELGEPIVGVQLNHEKSYAFVEFRSPEEATAALIFDNIVLHNTVLKLRRPKDYVPEGGVMQGAPHIPGVISTNVPDSPNKIFVGGLPSYLNDEQVIELLKSFGELKAFNLVKENGDPEKSKGFAFCEYVDPALTEVAIQGLNNMELGDRYLVVQRASVGGGARPPPGGGPPGGMMPPHMAQLPSFAVPGAGADAPATSRAIVMLNMVTAEELFDDQDYEDIVEDIREECSKYGEVEDLDIPRPTKKEKKWAPGDVLAEKAREDARSDEERGVGRVYVLFKSISGAQAGVKAIAGRQFGGKTIICAASDENEFLARKAARETAAAPPAPAFAE